MNRMTKAASRMNKWITIVMLCGIALVAGGLLLFQAGVLGLGESNVIDDARARLEQAGADPEQYQYMTSQGGTLFAVLAYPEDRADCRYYLYENRPGVDFGWHFVRTDGLGDGVTLAEVEDTGSVWLCANARGEIASVVYADGSSRALGGYPLVDTAQELHLFNADGEEILEVNRP